MPWGQSFIWGLFTVAAEFPAASLYNAPLTNWLGFDVIVSVLRNLCAVLLLFAVFNTQAAELQGFSSEQLRQRYLALIDDLRCPQCQNQNLSDSDSPIARDLRRTVLRMLERGSSDREITDYLVDRYGEFIIYMPRFKPNTYALWLLPAGLGLLGVVLVLLIIRRQRSDRRQAGEAGLSGDEQRRLWSLLDSSRRGDHREQLR